jgi:hypothetical protein
MMIKDENTFVAVAAVMSSGRLGKLTLTREKDIRRHKIHKIGAKPLNTTLQSQKTEDRPLPPPSNHRRLAIRVE